jgi:hypothetical protein
MAAPAVVVCMHVNSISSLHKRQSTRTQATCLCAAVALLRYYYCAEQVGFISIVWNDACDPKVFQLDVTLADDKNSARNRITTVPCSGDTAGVPTCMWMAAVKTEARDEYEGSGMRYVSTTTCSFWCAYDCAAAVTLL